MRGHLLRNPKNKRHHSHDNQRNDSDGKFNSFIDNRDSAAKLSNYQLMADAKVKSEKKPYELKSKKLNGNSVLQREEEEEAIKEIKALAPEGPGNLNTSSAVAKENLRKNGVLANLLTIQKSWTKEIPDIARQSVSEIGRDALYRLDNDVPIENSVQDHVNSEKKGLVRVKLMDEANKHKAIFEITFRAFILEKTQGGSCDHFAAATFLALAKKGKTPILISYEPQSDEEYILTAPDERPKHASVLSPNENSVLYEVDGWWPDGGRIRSVKSSKDSDAMFPTFDLKIKWKEIYNDYVQAMYMELEARYNKIEAEGALKKNKALRSETAPWKIEKRNQE